MKVNCHFSGIHVIKVGHWAPLSAFFYHSFFFSYVHCQSAFLLAQKTEENIVVMLDAETEAVAANMQIGGVQ
jgi:hypothetical protein